MISIHCRIAFKPRFDLKQASVVCTLKAASRDDASYLSNRFDLAKRYPHEVQSEKARVNGEAHNALAGTASRSQRLQ